MSNLQFQNDLDKLVEILPDRIRQHISYGRMEDVIESVLDIGRPPEIRDADGKIEYIEASDVCYDDIEYITSRVQNLLPITVQVFPEHFTELVLLETVRAKL